jgi:hypothetical protein
MLSPEETRQVLNTVIAVLVCIPGRGVGKDLGLPALFERKFVVKLKHVEQVCCGRGVAASGHP